MSFFTEIKTHGESASYMLYIHQVQIQAKMFSYFSGSVKRYNDDTLHELDMHNAGETF